MKCKSDYINDLIPFCSATSRFFYGRKWCEVKAGMHFSVLLVITIIDTNLATFFQALSFKENT